MKVYKRRKPRWLLEGRRVPAGTPGAVKQMEESDRWYGTVGGKAVPLSKDKAASLAMLRKLHADRDLARVGVVDPHAQHKKRPLLEHLADYRVHLASKGGTQQHLEETLARIVKLLADCRMETLDDLEAGQIEARLLAMRRGGPPIMLPAEMESFTPADARDLLGISPQALRQGVRELSLPVDGVGRGRRYPRATVAALAARRGRGLSAARINHYVKSVTAFSRWLVRRGRLPVDPLATLTLLDTATDRRHDRRELTTEELARLLETAQASPRVLCGLTGAERRALYLTAIVTGFRARALAGLTPEDCRLTDPTPAISLPARLAKNRRARMQPVPPEIAASLARWVQGRPAGEPLWGSMWHGATDRRAAEMLRADLADAGIPYRTQGPDGPLFADFHALRHSYITALVRSGVDLHTAQRLAGHATPAMTARYTHLHLDDLAKAVARLDGNKEGASPSVPVPASPCKSDTPESKPGAGQK